MLAVIALAALGAGSAIGAPAHWYWWTSRADGQRHCAQTSPGLGWKRSERPYLDLRCERPAYPAKTTRDFAPGQPEAHSPRASP